MATPKKKTSVDHTVATICQEALRGAAVTMAAVRVGFFVRLLLAIFSVQMITHGAVHVNAEEANFSQRSKGMLPTIAVNSVLSVVAYPNIGSVRRGDVVVFRNPRDNSPWIKRLIGLPGDKIQMKEADSTSMVKLCRGSQ